MIDDNEFPEVGLAAVGGPQRAAPAGGGGQAEEAFPDLGLAATPPPTTVQLPSRRSVDSVLLQPQGLWPAGCSASIFSLLLLSLSWTGRGMLHRLPESKTCLLL